MSDMQKYCMLRMVTGANNNKFYEMIYNGGTTYTVKFGRINSSSRNETKPISTWDRVRREKMNKGYKDVTETVSSKAAIVDPVLIQQKVLLTPLADAKTDLFLNKMKAYTDGLVKQTYSVKAEAVSQVQVDKAQQLIDTLNKIDNKNIKIQTIIHP